MKEFFAPNYPDFPQVISMSSKIFKFLCMCVSSNPCKYLKFCSSLMSGILIFRKNTIFLQISTNWLLYEPFYLLRKFQFLQTCRKFLYMCVLYNPCKYLRIFSCLISGILVFMKNKIFCKFLQISTNGVLYNPPSSPTENFNVFKCVKNHLHVCFLNPFKYLRICSCLKS